MKSFTAEREDAIEIAKNVEMLIMGKIFAMFNAKASNVQTKNMAPMSKKMENGTVKKVQKEDAMKKDA